MSKLPLYYRLGGEPALQACIFSLSLRLSAEPSLSHYFLKKNASFFEDHHQRSILVAFGGYAGFSMDDIAKAHWKMGIKTEEWEVFKKVMQESLEDGATAHKPASSPSSLMTDIEESMEKMERFRNLIVEQSLLQKIGGETKLHAVLVLFYSRLIVDPELKSFFTAVDLPRLINRQTKYLASCFSSSCLNSTSSLHSTPHAYSSLSSQSSQRHEEEKRKKEGGEGEGGGVTGGGGRGGGVGGGGIRLGREGGGGGDGIEGEEGRKRREARMRFVHSNFNLSDRHFLVFKLHFAKALRYFSYPADSVVDAGLYELEKSRHLILLRKTPFEEIGSMESLNFIVERFFDNMLENPILSPYFKERDLTKIKNGYAQYLAHSLGNKEPYVGASLRILHSHFYLSDLHLDAMRECLEKVLKSQNMPQSLIRDIIWALEKERREIIFQNTYDLVGGEVAIHKISEILARKISRHYSLGPLFKNRTEEEIREIMRWKVIYLLGGPRPFRGRDIVNAHINVKIENQHLNDMKFLLEESLREAGLTEGVVLEMIKVLNSKKGYFVKNTK